MTTKNLFERLREKLVALVTLLFILAMAAGTFWLERTTNWTFFYKKKAGQQVEQLQVEIDQMKTRLTRLEATHFKEVSQ